ncbi:unnamed protein product, partial [Prorocentrum cordatum]
AAPAPTALKLIDKVVQGFDLGQCIELGPLLADASLESEMSDADKQEIEARRAQLGSEVQQLAKDLLGPLVEAARKAKELHQQHMLRCASKRQRVEDGGGGSPAAAAGGGEGAAGSGSAVAAAGAQPAAAEAE